MSVNQVVGSGVSRISDLFKGKTPGSIIESQYVIPRMPTFREEFRQNPGRTFEKNAATKAKEDALTNNTIGSIFANAGLNLGAGETFGTGVLKGKATAVKTAPVRERSGETDAQREQREHDRDWQDIQDFQKRNFDYEVKGAYARMGMDNANMQGQNMYGMLGKIMGGGY